MQTVNLIGVRFQIREEIDKVHASVVSETTLRKKIQDKIIIFNNLNRVGTRSVLSIYFLISAPLKVAKIISN
jgi:hypothetical protein